MMLCTNVQMFEVLYRLNGLCSITVLFTRLLDALTLEKNTILDSNALCHFIYSVYDYYWRLKFNKMFLY